MNLVLYKSNEEDFETLGIGVLSDFITTPKVTEVLKGEYILEFDYMKNGKYCEYLLEQNIVKALNEPFRIVSVNPGTDGYKVLAKHLIYDLRNNFIEDAAPTNKTSQEALKWVLERTLFECKFEVSGDCTELASSRYVRTTPYDAFFTADNSILSKYGGEPEYKKYNIILHQRRGRDSGVEIREGKNLSGIKISKDFENIITKICPVGADGLLLPEMYVDSPLIDVYDTPRVAKQEFSDIGITEEVSQEEAYELLRKSCRKLFDEGMDKPVISVQVDFIELSKTKEYEKYQNLESLELGDTLRVYVPSLNQDYSIRVVKVIKDALTGRITNLELGNEIPSLVTYQTQKNNSMQASIKDSQRSAISEARNDLTKFINHPYNGHLIISEKTGEIFILDTTNIATAKEVWKFGLGGWGFSSSGIDGPYKSGLTKDGHFVANWITTGTMSAERIEGLSELILTVSGISKDLCLSKIVEGSSIEILDAGPYPLENIEIYGKTENDESVHGQLNIDEDHPGYWLMLKTCNKKDTEDEDYQENRTFIDMNIYDESGNITGNYEIAEGDIFSNGTLLKSDNVEIDLKYDSLELFEGYNYITLDDELAPNISIEYLTNSNFNSKYPSKAELLMESNRITNIVSESIKPIVENELSDVSEKITNLDEKLSSNIGSLSSSISQTASDVKIAFNSISTIEQKQIEQESYFSFSEEPSAENPFEKNPTITLGKNTNLNKQVIDNEGIKIIVSNQVVSKWVGNKFYCGEFHCGVFALIPRKNKNLTFRKVGK